MFTALAGSRLYGTFHETSDYDTRTVVKPPLEDILANIPQQTKHSIHLNQDVTTIPIQVFLNDLEQGQVQALETVQALRCGFYAHSYSMNFIKQIIDLPKTFPTKLYAYCKHIAHQSFRTRKELVQAVRIMLQAQDYLTTKKFDYPLPYSKGLMLRDEEGLIQDLLQYCKEMPDLETKQTWATKEEFREAKYNLLKEIYNV